MSKRLLPLVPLLSLLISIPSFSADYGEYHTDRIIIRIADQAGTVNLIQTPGAACFGLPELDAITQKYAVTKIEKLFPRCEKPSSPALTDLSRIFTVHFPAEIDLFRVIDAFKATSNIVYAEPYYIRKLLYNPNDPFTNQQYALTNIHAYQAWDYCQGDPDAVVCIDDTGIDMDHPDLADNLWINPGEDLNGNGIVDPGEENGIDDDQNGYIDDFWGWDYIDDDNWPDDNAILFGGHGSHCSGIASAVTDNNTGIASVGFDASLMIARVGYSLFVLYPYDGVQYAIGSGADVISMSWGGTAYSITEQAMFNWAAELGILCVAAAGNNGSSTPGYPAAYNNVISVAATDQNDHLAGFSNYGSTIDVCAPGVGIYSTYLNGGYTNMDGTSMACPMAAGLAALIKAAYPDFQADAIALVMEITCDNIDAQNPAYIGSLGWGRINAYEAMSMLYSDVSLTLTPAGIPIQIPAAGGSFHYDRLLQNSGTVDRTVSIYAVAAMPNGAYYRVSNELSQILPAGGQIQNLNMSQTVPSGAPLGNYSYIVLTMDETSRQLIGLDYFTFEKLGTMDNSGSDQSWTLSFSEPALSNELNAAPEHFELSEPYPNPFNPETSISFTLPEAGQVSLKVYDIDGRQTAVLTDGWKNAGIYEFTFNGAFLPSGIYFAVLNSGGFNQVRKLTLLK